MKHPLRVQMSGILMERFETNKNGYPVYSVSVLYGLVNQIDYLGRSFAAKDTSNYNVVHYGDVVYTKSPTGEFPYGIIKRSIIDSMVAVSPLYGVYIPKNPYIGIFLNELFCNPVKTKNYLHPLIQKGAKNTIIISNQRFLENVVTLPPEPTLPIVTNALVKLNDKIDNEQTYLKSLHAQKSFLLSVLFI